MKRRIQSGGAFASATMKWWATLFLLSVPQLAMARVFRQPLKPSVTPLTHYLRRTNMMDSLGEGTSNVTVEYLQNAFEWYLIDIALGTPPQNFTVLFDTGSDVLWVTDSRCKNSSDEGDEDTSCPREPVPGYKRRTFNDAESTTLKKTDRRTQLGYGAGDVNGSFAMDVFSTGGVQVDNITTVLVDAMIHDGRFLPITPFDGIFGAWLSEKAYKESFPSSIQYVLRQIDQQLFTIALSGHVGQKAGSGGGFITYGGLDDVNCAKDWKYVDVDATSLNWYTLVDGVSYGSSKESVETSALLDTGNPRLEIPSRLVEKIASDANAVKDDELGVYLVDCDVKGLPDIVLTIGGHEYPIPSKEYIIDIELQPGKCVLNLREGGEGVGIGDPFYRTFCTSYDFVKKRVGFAKSLIRNHPTAPSTTNCGLDALFDTSLSKTAVLVSVSKFNDSK